MILSSLHTGTSHDPRALKDSLALSVGIYSFASKSSINFYFKMRDTTDCRQGKQPGISVAGVILWCQGNEGRDQVSESAYS